MSTQWTSTEEAISSLHAATKKLRHVTGGPDAIIAKLIRTTTAAKGVVDLLQSSLHDSLLRLTKLHQPVSPRVPLLPSPIHLSFSAVAAPTHQPNQCALQIHTPSSISSTIPLPRVPKPPSLKSPEKNIPPIVSPPPSGTSQLHKPSSTSTPHAPELATLIVTPLLTPTQLPLKPPLRPLLLPLPSTPQQSSHPFDLPTCPSLTLCAPCVAPFRPSHRCSTSQFPQVFDASPAPTPPLEPPPVLSLVPLHPQIQINNENNPNSLTHLSVEPTQFPHFYHTAPQRNCIPNFSIKFPFVVVFAHFNLTPTTTPKPEHHTLLVCSHRHSHYLFAAVVSSLHRRQ